MEHAQEIQAAVGG